MNESTQPEVTFEFERGGRPRRRRGRGAFATDSLRVALYIVALLLVPRWAVAQYVSDETSASPNPFEQYDEITIDIEGNWDSYTTGWPCEEDPEDGYCTVQEHDLYVSGSDGYYDWDQTEDWGDSSGEDSWEFYDLDGPAYMQPISYGSEIDVEYCDEWHYACWWISDDGGADVYPDAPTITSDNGDTVWWFNGEDPDSGGWPTSITLTSSGGSATEWSIDAESEFGPAVELSTESGESTTVTANDVGSGSASDMGIVASVGGQRAVFWVTARIPAYLNLSSYGDNCNLYDPDWGYLTNIQYEIRDQLDSVLNHQIPVNEHFLSSYPTIDWPVETDGWDMPLANGGVDNKATDSSGTLSDNISIWIPYSREPWPTPTPLSDIPCDGSQQVDHWGQELRIGSSTEGSGVLVQTDTLQRYRGSADHVDIR